MKCFLHWLTEVLWPSGVKCLCCNNLSEGKCLCSSCQEGLETMRLEADEQVTGHALSVYRYDGVPKQLVRLLKEECVADAAEALANGMEHAIREIALPANTVFTWVTMPERRRKARGIDHGRKLCEALARRMEHPCRQLLSRTGHLHTQRGLNREARLRNLSGSLHCHESISEPVLIIDDVMTTGATAMACTEILLAAGAPQVYVVTATKAMLKKQKN